MVNLVNAFFTFQKVVRMAKCATIGERRQQARPIGTRMKHIIAIAMLATALAGSAQANTYTFDQTGGTAGFHAAVTVALAGHATLIDLPTLDDVFDSTGPYDFAPLTALKIDFTNPGGVGRVMFTLADFTAPIAIGGFPRWAIEPGSIGLFDATDNDDFTIAGLTISYDTDGGGLCGVTGTCVATGTWAAPEPSSLPLILSALAGLLALGVTRYFSVRRPRAVEPRSLWRGVEGA